MLNLFRFVGIRHIKMRPVRSVLTTLGIALGITLFIAIEIINRSTLASFRDNVNAVSGQATLTVAAGETGFPEDKLEIVKKIPGVQYAVPLIETRGYLTNGDQSSETVVILGVDLLQDQAVRTYKTSDNRLIDDPLVFLNHPDSIILTYEYAKKHDLKMNSSFSLATVRGIQKFTVRGLLSPQGPARAFGGAIALMDIDGARVTFGKENKLDRIDIVTQPDQNPLEVAKAIRKVLGKGYQVERPETKSEGMERMVKSYQMMLQFFSTLALLVGVFLVANSVSISVAERKREIGTLRALGATRLGILILFLSEATAMGVVGASIGAGLGRLLASGLVGQVSRGMSSQYLTKVDISHLEFHLKDVFAAMVLGGVAAFCAALWPAVKATWIQPLDAMKSREVGEETGKKGMFRYSPWIGAALLIFVTVASENHWSKTYPWIENLDQFFSVFGSVLLGPTFVMGLIRLIRPLALPLGGAVTRLAQDNLVRNPKRTASNVISLMAGLVLVILIACVNVSFKSSILQWFDKILRFDLVVSSTGRIISYQSQPLHEEVGKELLEVSGLKKRVTGLRFLHIPYGDERMAMKAYDEPDPDLEYSSLDMVDRPAKEAGYELYHSKDPVVMVSENFSLNFKKKTGDFLELETPSGQISFKIIGILVDFASDRGVIYIARDAYKKYWKDNLVNAFGLQLAPGAKLSEVQKDLDLRFGKSKSLMVISNAEMRQQMAETIDQGFSYTKAIEFAALCVGLLGLLNTLLVSVMERMREIGMLRAVGMSRKQLSWMILQEALFQGGFGALAAISLGSWLGYVWITHSLSTVLGWIVQFHFPWISVFYTVGIGLAVAVIAGFFPARRAAQMEIREALEYE